MDWVTHDAPHARWKEPPAPRLVETYWRAVAPSKKELACGLYRTDAGLELRCGYSVDDLIRSTRIGQQDEPRFLAAGWLHVVLSKGSFTVVESLVEDERRQAAEVITTIPDDTRH
jgi:hypothetical protein